MKKTQILASKCRTWMANDQTIVSEKEFKKAEDFLPSLLVFHCKASPNIIKDCHL